MQFALLRHGRLGFVQVDLAVRAAEQKQLCSVGEKLGRTTFVGLDVRMPMTEDAMKRLTQLREGERIRGRAVEDEKDIAIGFENFANARANARGPGIFAV